MSAAVDPVVLEREHRAFVELLGVLSPYAQGLADIDLTDEEMAAKAGRLRTLLEAVRTRLRVPG